LLAEHFLTRVRQLPSSSLAEFFQLLVKSVHSKDLQVYLNSSVAEGILHSYYLDASVQSPNWDSLFVVDANISGNKANSFIINTLDDQVTIDAKGNAIHHTRISYAWTVEGQDYGNPLYRDFARIYVPPGSVLLTQGGWQPRGTSEAFGREVWAGFFTLTIGQTRVITLTWTVPGAAKKEANGWHYQYLIQRQAGAQWKLYLQVTLPCAAMNNKWEGLVPSNTRVATLSQSLSGDLNVASDYSC